MQSFAQSWRADFYNPLIYNRWFFGTGFAYRIEKERFKVNKTKTKIPSRNRKITSVTIRFINLFPKMPYNGEYEILVENQKSYSVSSTGSLFQRGVIKQESLYKAIKKCLKPNIFIYELKSKQKRKNKWVLIMGFT